MNDLVENGYVILPKAIHHTVISSCIASIEETVATIASGLYGHSDGGLCSNFLTAIGMHSQYDVQAQITKYLAFQGLKKRILQEPEVLGTLVNLIGPDLQYCLDSQITVNVQGVTDDFLVKKGHQEFWSGAGLNTLQTWAPIVMEPGVGGMEIIPGSHLWGHIPHQNREPVGPLPDETYVPLDMAVGDMVIFHSLLLHRTVPNESEMPRFAVPQMVRNFREPDTGFGDLQNWEILNLSPMSEIRKKLGNPHLSPFRTVGSERC